jgi:hypothetical protein
VYLKHQSGFHIHNFDIFPSVSVVILKTNSVRSRMLIQLAS